MNDQDLIFEILKVAGPIVGAMVGGLITITAMYGLQRQKYRHEKKENCNSLKRDALTAALEWIEPMRNSWSSANSLVTASIHGTISEDEFIERWPDLLSNLAQRDLPGNFRAVLPEGVYSSGHKIIRELENLQILGIKYGQIARLENDHLPGFQECSNKLNKLEDQISKLETKLNKEFKGTFE